MSDIKDFFKKLFHIKSDETFHPPVVKPEVIKRRPQKSVIVRMLGGLDRSHIYHLLNNDVKQKGVVNIYGGLGLDFQNKDHTRHRLVSDAFNIDDVAKTASISSLAALDHLASAYKSGDIHGLKKNITKRVLCLALIGGEAGDSEIKRNALIELQKLYTKNSNFKDRKDCAEILKLVDSKLKKMPAPAPKVVQQSTAVIADKLTVIAPAAVSVKTPDTQPVSVAVKPVASLVQPAPVVLPPVADKVAVQPVVASQDSNVINMVNAVRKILFGNIAVWEDKTTLGMFFGGIKIENPARKGNFIRVPNGIAKMINMLQKENLQNADVTDASKAKLILESLCRIAFERYKLGSRRMARYEETNKLYTILSSLTTQFYWAKDTIQKFNPALATFNSEKINSDLVDKVNLLLTHPNPVVATNKVVLAH